MPFVKRTGINSLLLIFGLIISLIFISFSCNGDRKGKAGNALSSGMPDSSGSGSAPTIVMIPENPRTGESFRILVIAHEFIRKTKITVSGPSGDLEPLKTVSGGEYPYWRFDDFTANSPGKYKVSVTAGKKFTDNLEFTVSDRKATSSAGIVWKSFRGWDSGMEDIYSAWIKALVSRCDENASWSSLHEVTQNKDQNFLYNYLSLGEDDPEGKNSVIMQPDCADNPFFLRAYFAWKLGLPFGYHVCDRGYLGRNPKPGQWITNETSSSKSNPVAAFNNFLRMMKDGVQSGTARTALDDEKSDYYPVQLEQGSLRPGTVFADPYGHTLILTGWVPQTNGKPGILLSVDAQPDGTVGIKQFWKGNFLFNTSGVIGEPGFKAFRPIAYKKGVARPVQNKELNAAAGFVPFSLQQKKMAADVFYHTMERLINPDPLDPETALIGLINALHEQLMVRVTSVANGEAYFKSHPGTLISMPSSAAGNFSGRWSMGRLLNSEPRSETSDCNGCSARFPRSCCRFT